MKLLFVSFVKNKSKYQQDPSFIYRCQNVALALAGQGIDSNEAHIKAISLRMIRDSECVVLHRPHFSARFWALLSLLKRMGKTVIADYDDLVFDPQYAEYSPAFLNSLTSLSDVRQKYELHRKALDYIDNFTVSTEPLKQYLQRCRPQSRIAVIPNAVHASWHRLPASTTSGGRSRKVIAYMSGTRSHDRDFLEVKPSLEKLLNERNDVEFRVIGRLNFDLDAPQDKVVRIDRLAYCDYVKTFKKIEVNIAPLEDTPFNQCKSALKAIEAGFWGVPTVASNNLDYCRVQSAGVWVVRSKEDWYRQLVLALEASSCADTRASISQKNIDIASVDAMARQFLSFCESSR